MSDLFLNLARQANGTAAIVQPLPVARFEPPAGMLGPPEWPVPVREAIVPAPQAAGTAEPLPDPKLPLRDYADSIAIAFFSTPNTAFQPAPSAEHSSQEGARRGPIDPSPPVPDAGSFEASEITSPLPPKVISPKDYPPLPNPLPQGVEGISWYFYSGKSPQILPPSLFQREEYLSAVPTPGEGVAPLEKMQSQEVASSETDQSVARKSFAGRGAPHQVEIKNRENREVSREQPPPDGGQPNPSDNLSYAAEKQSVATSTTPQGTSTKDLQNNPDPYGTRPVGSQERPEEPTGTADIDAAPAQLSQHPSAKPEAGFTSAPDATLNHAQHASPAPASVLDRGLPATLPEQPLTDASNETNPTANRFQEHFSAGNEITKSPARMDAGGRAEDIKSQPTGTWARANPRRIAQLSGVDTVSPAGHETVLSKNSADGNLQLQETSVLSTSESPTDSFDALGGAPRTPDETRSLRHPKPQKPASSAADQDAEPVTATSDPTLSANRQHDAREILRPPLPVESAKSLQPTQRTPTKQEMESTAPISTVRITIGRIVVRAAQSTAPVSQTPAPPKPLVLLGDYLKQNKESG